MEAWSRYLAFYKPSWKIIVLTSLASTLQAGLGIPIAWLLRRLFDSSTLTGGELAVTLGGIVLIYLAGDALLIFSQRRNLALVKPIARRMRMQMVERAMLRPRTFDRGNSFGAVHSALVQDVELVDHMSSAVLSRLLPAFFSVCVLFALLAWLSLPLFLVTLIILTFGWLVTTFYRRRVRAQVIAFDGVRNAYNAGAIGILQRLDLARTHGAEQAELARHAELSGHLAASGIAVAGGNNALFVLHNQIAVFMAISVLFAGHRLVESGSMTIGALLAFYVVLAMSRGHLTSFATLMPGLLSGHAALQRLQPLLASSDNPVYSGARVIEFDGGVDLIHVCYGYDGKAVLSDASMAIAPGRVSGLGGPNGSGKTTIARLILGLDRPSDGFMRVGGFSYDELSIEALRRKIAYVAQDPVLFAGSVRDNLFFGLDEAPSDDFVANVLAMVGASFVQELETGLNAWLGDGGVRLSGGQRQRLSIARAILRKPALMILDEPTNHLGQAEARAIVDRIRRDNPRIAVLVISHDPQMLAAADQSWRVVSGVLIERIA